MNKACKIAGIKLLLKKNYRLESDVIDLESFIDTTLSFYENWKLIKTEFLKDKFCSCCGQYLR